VVVGDLRVSFSLDVVVGDLRVSFSLDVVVGDLRVSFSLDVVVVAFMNTEGPLVPFPISYYPC
jgi:hypothetical protein